ncbi:T9SS type A sorting domain-containing protein [Flavobacterium sp.]|uniref:T9SS type A sorting domain-containing protein n=1 Tax=Flavobacterium sp. TaxID=239 RepID=UPI002636D269|nr:T9SS type A sorting domain-containing protein [Flavobacterium sp.]
MRKFFLMLVFSFCLIINFANAQLFVSSNSYVYNEGALLFVNQDVELQSNSNIYLRNEAQLLQGGTVLNGSNKGQGTLSVFQEGTANNFGYNYWCSPVGVPVSSSSVNNNFHVNGVSGVIKRPISKTAFQTPSFVSGYDGYTDNSELQISSFWIYKYKALESYSSWEHVGTTGFVEPGLGFTMKGIEGDDTTTGIGEATFNNRPLFDDQRYDFRGKPNDGDINIEVLAPTVGTQYPNSTLTGNPYPSAINLNYFLLENSGYTINYTTGVVSSGGSNHVINGNAYFWEHQKPATTHNLAGYVGGYGIYAPNNVNANSPGTYANAPWNTYTLDGSVNVSGTSSGTNLYKRMFTPIGQGFMVQGFANGNAVMRNKYRAFVKEDVLNNSEFERVSSVSNVVDVNNWNEIPNVAGVDYTLFSKLEVPQIKIHTILNNQYTREVILAFNPNTTDGFDVAMDAVSNGSSLPNDAYFSITGNNNPFVITTLPFDVSKRVPFTIKSGGTSTFKINVGNIINFIGSNEIYLYDGLTGIYHDIKNNFFEITLPVGIYENRFEVTFTDQALSNDNNLKNTFAIVQNNTIQTLSISNPNLLNLKSIMLFDVSGKLIFNENNLETETNYEFSTNSISDGVYIVSLKDANNKTFNQKIIVENVK